jgi:ribosome-binding protein aMBF1 (putative translation factor)
MAEAGETRRSRTIGSDRRVGVAERVGKNLRRARRREGLSQEQLALRAGLHRTEVGRLERGDRICRIDTLLRLAGAMAISPGELLEGITWVPVSPSVGSFAFGGVNGSGFPGRTSSRSILDG